jgi:hypothetical protein
LNNPFQGVSLGQGCYKIRLSIGSKGQGKSGSARVITLVKLQNNRITLLSIYDKAEYDTITKARLDDLIKEEGLD